MRLLRPHVPLSVRCNVACRQLGVPFLIITPSYGDWLRQLLRDLAERLGCAESELHLDHDPALGAREKVHDWITGEHTGYVPDANSAAHLIYREAGAHRLKTNVRGEHGQHPDRVLIKKARRLTENKPPKRKVKIQSRGFGKVSRPFPKKGK